MYGDVSHGETAAIMGPSGAGKSTLMDLLALRHVEGKVTGSIQFEGQPVTLNFIHQRAYVPQVGPMPVRCAGGSGGAGQLVAGPRVAVPLHSPACPKPPPAAALPPPLLRTNRTTSSRRS